MNVEFRLIGLIILIAAWNFYYEGKEETNIVILVPSSQENFKNRQSIRKTWKSLVNNQTTKFFFVIGSKMCDIPVQDRREFFECSDWSILLKKDISNDDIFTTHAKVCKGNYHTFPIINSFNFEIHHDIVLKEINILGDFKDLQKYWNQKCDEVSIKLVDVSIKETIFHTDLCNEDVNFLNNNFLISTKLKRHYLLPNGFLGQIVVDATFLQNNFSCVLHWNSAVEGLISYTYGMSPMTNDYEEYVDTTASFISFGFSVHNLDKLKNHISNKSTRLDLWKSQMKILKDQLAEEAKQYKDIIFVDVVDVYRNLPSKLLQSFTWAVEEYKFKYLLKADDDTFIDMVQIEKELNSLNPHTAKEFWWWALFRKYWAVQKDGKWREGKYLSATYPPFPCGSGYVLSHSIVEYLGKHVSNWLHSFQGEDVSMGIWLASVNPHRHTGAACEWTCGNMPSRRPCNIGQVTSENMYEIWESYEKCGYLCNKCKC